MKTVILMWNPAISSFTFKMFKNYLAGPFGTDFDWSVWDWKEVHAGDRFFMVRVGDEGKGGKGNGIVMSGYLNSEPHRGEDWSGKGREVYYVDLAADYLFDTEKVRTLTDEFLMQSFPQFDWTGGHSGRILDDETAALLEECWEKVLIMNADLLSNGRHWRTAVDVFRRYPVVELWRGHYKGRIEFINAEFYGKGLIVSYFNDDYYTPAMELLPKAPRSKICTSCECYKIGLVSLKKALGVDDNRGVAKILRRDYSTRDGMTRLLKFAKKAGCKITESFILVD